MEYLHPVQTVSSHNKIKEIAIQPFEWKWKCCANLADKLWNETWHYKVTISFKTLLEFLEFLVTVHLVESRGVAHFDSYVLFNLLWVKSETPK